MTLSANMNTKINQISYWKRMVFLLGLFKIPLIGLVKPKILHVDDKTVKVLIRLRRRTKNHLNSMYFGALAIGADVSAGIHAFYFAEQYGKKVAFAFKGMKAEFHKRAETNIEFVCKDGEIVKDAIKRSISTGERINENVTVNAFNLENELVASFVMEVSVRVK